MILSHKQEYSFPEYQHVSYILDSILSFFFLFCQRKWSQSKPEQNICASQCFVPELICFGTNELMIQWCIHKLLNESAVLNESFQWTIQRMAHWDRDLLPPTGSFNIMFIYPWQAWISLNTNIKTHSALSCLIIDTEKNSSKILRYHFLSMSHILICSRVLGGEKTPSSLCSGP